jgi:hypothetical protein
MSSYQYCYEPLENPSEQIRLLTLDATRDNGSIITARLSTHRVPLRNASRRARLRSHLGLPGYWAVSYVWGAQSNSNSRREIVVDGRLFLITANLHAALRQFRATMITSIHLWVDAICINQADDNEKSAQIPLMRDIYHLALGVQVWLGEATSESDRVLRFIGDLSRHPLTNKLDDLSVKLADIDTKARDTGQQKRPVLQKVRSESERALISGLFNGLSGLVRGMYIGLDLKYNSLKDHLDNDEGLGLDAQGDLLKLMSWRPNEKALKLVQPEDFREMGQLLEKTIIADTQYFNRMWTLQEVCVAQMANVSLQRGTLSMELDDFTRSIYYLRSTFNISTPSLEKITQLTMIGLHFSDGRRLSLRDLLFQARGRESEDPRDKIYALHGLMKDDMNPLLQPDYSKPAAEVFANAARHLIAVEKSLDILCGHQLQPRLEGLPSWVPDFRHFGLQTGVLVPAWGRNTIYHASLSEIPQLPGSLLPPQAWETLAVTGIFLDTVASVSDLLALGLEQDVQGFGSSEKLWAKALMESQKLIPEEFEAIKSISDLVSTYFDFYHDLDRETFWTRKPNILQQIRSLTGKAYHQSSEAASLHFQYLMTLLCGRTPPEARCNRAELEEHMTRACIPNAAGIKTLENLCQSLVAGTRHRRLIITARDGIQLGAAPEETQKDDVVCVLTGCNVPVILRRTTEPDAYQFIGECYFHDFMDGEALALRDEGKLIARTFSLR